ncbi:MAG: condensation domain-containing protein, partial [Oscillospiraceae bacterium]
MITNLNETPQNNADNFQEKRTLLALMAQKKTAEKSDVSYDQDKIPKVPRNGKDYFPLSFSQERMWFMEQLQPGNPAYIVSTAYHITGQLNTDYLEKSFCEISKRHEIWRTTFEVRNGQPVQIVHPETFVRLSKVDLQELAPQAGKLEVEKLIEKESTKPINITQGPLWRVQLITLAKEEHVLILTSHHLIIDGTSIGILLKELAEYYSAYINNQFYELSPLPIQYVDYAVWQRQSALESGQVEFWDEKLQGELPVLELPFDHPRPPIQTLNSKTHWQMISNPLFSKIQKFSSKYGATRVMVLMATFKVLLHHYSGLTDIIVGVPVAGRTHPDVQLLMGCFINNMVIRTQIQREMSYNDWINHV